MAKILFKWLVARPDWRQYRQNSSEFEPQDVLVEVDVPGEEKFVVGQDKKTVTLTPAGMFLALETLQAAFIEPKKVADSEEEWGDTSTEKEEKKVTAPTSSDDDDDGWGDDDETVVDSKAKTSSAGDNTDAPWDENEEDWEA